MKPLATKEKTIDMKPINTRSLTQKNTASQISFAQPHNPPMTEQFIVPPARVWEKIEMILDQQDMNRQAAIIRLPSEKKQKKAFSIYFAAAGATILAGLFWIWR